LHVAFSFLPGLPVVGVQCLKAVWGGADPASSVQAAAAGGSRGQPHVAVTVARRVGGAGGAGEREVAGGCGSRRLVAGPFVVVGGPVTSVVVGQLRVVGVPVLSGTVGGAVARRRLAEGAFVRISACQRVEPLFELDHGDAVGRLAGRRAGAAGCVG